eukprot:TRINITY_DN10396_c0_g1_i1.p1 TRINITY_DN10396_c0_g1~~TRINITY_DN10396_c0_g1_i1.p1  ORF type:complete len:137 (-),score=16.71 TRINITY_DN10396_c0_g1_i1:91-501(-)
MLTLNPILLSLITVFEVESKTLLVEVENLEKKPNGKDYDLEKSCKIHHQCESWEVCTKSGICKALACQTDLDCENEVNLPSSCVSIVSGGQGFCYRETTCENDAECAKAGKDYRCQPNTHRCEAILWSPVRTPVTV